MAKAKPAPEPTTVPGPAPATEQTKTKAQAIRDALNADPDGMPKVIAEKLSAEGWKASAQEVSQIKYQLKAAKKKTGEKAASNPAKAVAAAPAAVSSADAPADLVSVAALQKAKKLVQELGGVKEAKRALAALGQLLD